MKPCFIIFFVFIIIFFQRESISQIYSEAPIVVLDDIVLTDMFYVKFKHSDVIDFNKEKGKFTISNRFPEIDKIIDEFCFFRQINLDDIQIRRAIPRANDSHLGLYRVYMFIFPRLIDIETIISELKGQPEVEYAHGPVQWVDCADFSPNDDYYISGDQWYLNAIQAPDAWQICRENTNVKIALIEKSGVELTHDDLQGNIAGGDGNPNGLQGDHGTQVAGFAGGVTNNDSGIASLGWNVSLLTYQPFNEDSLHTVLAGKIYDAVADGADIINMSFKTLMHDLPDCDGTEQKDSKDPFHYWKNWDYELVRDVIDYAIYEENRVVVASAGNAVEKFEGETPCDSIIPYPIYPAQYPGVIGVSGSYQNGNFVDGWNYGNHVDVNAPGATSPAEKDGLMTTYLNNGYLGTGKGTSFSAPQVAALTAMMKSLNPSLTPTEIEQILESTADKIGQYSYVNGWNQYMGYGRINALKAVLEAEQGTWYNAYKNKSLEQNATYSNSNRHLVKGAGYLHEVFTSNNYVFYRRKSESEGTWNVTKRISDETSGNKNGSILFRPSYNTLHVVWERQVSVNQYEVWYSKSNVNNINWSTPVKLATVNISSYQPGATPVVSFIEDPSKLVVVYCSGSGLYDKYSTNDGTSWNIPASKIFSSTQVRYPSLSCIEDQDIIQLGYDLRADWQGVYSRIYDGTNWSSARSMGDITGTVYNRTVSVAYDPVMNRPIAAWRGQEYNGGLDPYYSIVFRAGKRCTTNPNEWDSWFEVFQHLVNETAYSPSLTRFYPEGSGSNIGVDIVNSTTAYRIQLKKYYIHEGTGWDWDDIEISDSGDWPNITDLGTDESDPCFIFTNQNGSPYQI